MTDPSRSPADLADVWPDEPANAPFTPPVSAGRLPWLAVLLTLLGFGLIGASVWGPQASVQALRSAGASLLDMVNPPARPDVSSPAPPQADPAVRTKAGDDGTAEADRVPDTGHSAAQPSSSLSSISLSTPRVAARKCTRDGHTTFTDAPCPAGTRAEDLDMPRVVASGGATPGTVTLYRCRSHNGAHFWSPTHCHRQGARVDRMTEVSAELPLAEQKRLAEQRRLAVQAGTTAAPTPRLRLAQGRSTDADGARARCGWIEQRIEHIDSQARQPLSGPHQDQLRSERQALRQEQFSLRCP